MNTIGELALATLLTEYSDQLREGYDKAVTDLKQYVEPTVVRRWNKKEGAFVIPQLFPPTENTPPDQWYWEEVYDPHPALDNLAKAIEKIENFAVAYRDKLSNVKSGE